MVSCFIPSDFILLQCYNLPVFVNVFPPLQTYIKNVLTEALTLLEAKNLSRVELKILKDDEVLESFVVDLNSERLTSVSVESLNNLEETFRSCIFSLEKRCKLFKKASKDFRFKVLLHTNSHHNYASETRNLVSLNLPKKLLDFNAIFRISSG
jgi:hypothetical protein